MVKNDSHIDVIFRDRLNNTEILPPASVWDNIEPFIRKRNNKGIFFRMAAGLALLISLGMMGYFFSGNIADKGTNTTLAASGYELSSLFEPSYIDISVESRVNTLHVDNELITKAGNEMLSTAEITENEVENGEIAAEKKHREIDLQNERLTRTALRFVDAPADVPARSLSDNVLVTDIMPVELTDEGKMKRWELGARVSPTYLSNNLRTANDVLRQVNDNESPALSYTGGFSLSYKMNGRLSLQTGLYYSSLGRDVNGVTSYSGFSPFASSKSGVIFDVETSSGTISSTNRDIYLADRAGDRIDGYYSVDNFDPSKSSLVPFGNQLRQNFEYLRIPLIVRYKIIDKKLDFNILGGMAYNFLIGNQTWAMNEAGSKVLLGSTAGVDKLLLSSSLGMSMEYELSERFSLNLEPEVRYFLNTGGDLGSGNPYSFGIFSGMQFKF
ncbi:MAG: outer membrane beta-barrel protein [Bacteroidales bacterium]|nr:outer membrane beta-barrel protein [Bacteroidales bacterium]